MREVNALEDAGTAVGDIERRPAEGDGDAAAELSPGAHLVAAAHSVSPAERALSNGHPGGVLWFTGLSGAGKSTLAMALQRRLFDAGRQVYVIDGDNLRQGLSRDLGFAAADRSENIRRAAEVARMLADAGVIVIVALISPHREDRAAARRIVGEGFHEVFIDADLATCERRDPKGLYARARAGVIPRFTGVSAPYEAPSRPDLAVDTAAQSVEAALAGLVRHVDRWYGTGANGAPAAAVAAGASRARSLVKSATWRITATAVTFVISLAVTGSVAWAGSIAGFEAAIKFAIYYLHERAWAGLAWGRR